MRVQCISIRPHRSEEFFPWLYSRSVSKGRNLHPPSSWVQRDRLRVPAGRHICSTVLCRVASVVFSPSSTVQCPATCVYSILTQVQHHSGAGILLPFCRSLTLSTVFKSRAPGLSSQKGTAVEYNLC